MNVGNQHRKCMESTCFCCFQNVFLCPYRHPRRILDMLPVMPSQMWLISCRLLTSWPLVSREGGKCMNHIITTYFWFPIPSFPTFRASQTKTQCEIISKESSYIFWFRPWKMVICRATSLPFWVSVYLQGLSLLLQDDPVLLMAPLRVAWYISMGLVVVLGRECQFWGWNM